MILMRPRILLQACVLVAASLWIHPLAMAQQVQGESLVVPETFRDVGRLDLNATSRQVFLLKNQGKKSVTILDIQKTCSCTTVTLDRKTLEPGEERELILLFQNQGWPGRFTAEATLRTDDPRLPEFRITLSALFSGPFQCYPPELDFGRLKSGEPVSRGVKLYGFGKQPLEIRNWKSDSPWLHVEEIREGHPIRKAEKSASVLVIPEGEGAQEGHITFLPDDPSLQPVTLAVRYTIEPARKIEKKPAALFLAEPAARKKGNKGTIEITEGYELRSTLEFLAVKKISGKSGMAVYEYSTAGPLPPNVKRGKIGELEILDGQGSRRDGIPVFY